MSDHSPPAVEMPKRKRNGDDGNPQSRRTWIPQPPPPQSASEFSIQYLVDNNLPKLDLVPGDGPELQGIIRMIDAYEFALAHHESLAARLGAQMTSPKLVKALDSLFEGTIAVVDQFPNGRPQPSWMEVVSSAKANPDVFVLTRAADGTRCCQFTIRDFLCTISENDWRLIISGAVDRFGLVPVQGAPEDEAAELATVEILEDRLQNLIMNADKVAEKARQLNYRLGGRKAGIKLRLSSSREPGGSGSASQSLHPPRYNLKEDLLSQFAAPVRSTPFNTSATQSPRAEDAYDDSLSPHLVHEAMYARVESLPKGGKIFPRCDLCRKRKKTECLKNASACEDCTKKHAKCTWHNVTQDEAASLVASVKNAVVARARQEVVSAPEFGRGAASAPNLDPVPLQAARQVYQGHFGANSSSVRRSVEGGSDAGFNRQPLPDLDSGQGRS